MRFIYIADTHFGGNDQKGFMKQPRYLKYSDAMVAALAEWIKEDGDIDFILHAGDLVDEFSPEKVEYACALLACLNRPVYLALGNHDLTEPQAVEYWLKHASHLFYNSKADYCFKIENIVFDIRCLSWGREPYWWQNTESQCPYWTAKPEKKFFKNAAYKILVTHSPVFGIPVGQTGFMESFHSPPEDFTSMVMDEIKENRYDLVLGAHNHMNMCMLHNDTAFITVSAFAEAPFEFKLFEIDDYGIKMQTISLAKRMPFKFNYDDQSSYVQGRTCDRTLDFKKADCS